MTNIFSNIPAELANELFEDILITDKFKIERIVSKGQTSPDTGCYDQNETPLLAY